MSQRPRNNIINLSQARMRQAQDKKPAKQLEKSQEKRPTNRRPPK